VRRGALFFVLFFVASSQKQQNGTEKQQFSCDEGTVFLQMEKKAGLYPAGV